MKVKIARRLDRLNGIKPKRRKARGIAVYTPNKRRGKQAQNNTQPNNKLLNGYFLPKK